VHTTCGEDNGVITISATGGAGPLEYTVEGEGTSSSNIFEDLAAGVYGITVTDANGC
jgi:hypothetical protein